MLPANIHIYQIFYDTETYRKLDKGFISLDNTENCRPDWFEFWVIRNFVSRNHLDPDGWYGFLSANFGRKTSLTAKDVIAFVTSCEPGYDVAILPHCWDEVAYFLNPFEQGELVHKGISELSAKVLFAMGGGRGIDSLVNHSGSFTFSNYIVAKPVYWSKWLEMADALFWMAEAPASSLQAELTKTTRYRASTNCVQFKVFIQERLPALLLSDNSLRTSTYDVSAIAPIHKGLSSPGFDTREILQVCDRLKKEYCEGGSDKALGVYLDLRRLIRADYAR